MHVNSRVRKSKRSISKVDDREIGRPGNERDVSAAAKCQVVRIGRGGPFKRNWNRYGSPRPGLSSLEAAICYTSHSNDIFTCIAVGPYIRRPNWRNAAARRYLIDFRFRSAGMFEKQSWEKSFTSVRRWGGISLLQGSDLPGFRWSVVVFSVKISFVGRPSRRRASYATRSRATEVPVRAGMA